MILCRIFDKILLISMRTLLTKIFFVLISKTLMFPCCFVDDSLMILWRDIFETLIFSVETFLIFIVFDVLTSESFMFHRSFSDDSLMTFLWNIDDTTKIWTQTLKINEVSNVIIIGTLILFAAWLINRWWSYAESLIRSCWFRCKHYWNYFYCANLRDIDVSLLLRRWFDDDPLKRHFETLINSMETFLIFIVFLVLTSEALMFPCCFVDDSLMILWRYIFETLIISMKSF